MSFTSKLSLCAAAVCISASTSFADEIFEIPQTRAGTFSSLSAKALNDLEIVDTIPQLGIVVTRSNTASKRALASGLRSLGSVSEVRLIDPVKSSSETVPSGLWGLKAIRLSKAWAVAKGEGVVVAVSDTGISAAHPDLYPQMWTNPGETGLDSKGKSKANNGVDDDGNGYVDDVYGWNFVKKSGGGVDNHFHGTHVAGTIAARVTKAMAGVAPRARVMDVSFLDSKGSGNDINGAKTIVYAVDQGAKIINCSWGGTKRNATLEKAIAYAESKGVLVVVAAGNDNQDTDRKPSYPNVYDFANIVSVGATSTEGGSRASFSNYGKTTVELAAPGDSIKSLKPNSGYTSLSGTSMATPHVSGVAALVWSAHPNYSAAQVKKALMATRAASGWKGKSITEGQLDAELAVSH